MNIPSHELRVYVYLFVYTRSKKHATGNDGS